MDKVRHSIHADRDRQFADRSNKISQRGRVTIGRNGRKRGFGWLIGGYGCMIDCRGVWPMGMEGVVGWGTTDAEHAGSSVLTSDERQPLPNNFPTLGNGKQTHRDRQRSERRGGDGISPQSQGMIVREGADSISPD